jgi:hypothetical protein
MQGLGVKKFHSYSFKEGCLENSRGRWGRGVFILALSAKGLLNRGVATKSAAAKGNRL